MKRTQRGWFVVGVQLSGVWTLIQALHYFRIILEVLFRWANLPDKFTMSAYIFGAFTETFLGLYLLFYAHRLASLVYPQPHAQDGGGDAPASDENAGAPPAKDNPPE